MPSGELEAALAAMSDAAKVKKYYRPGGGGEGGRGDGGGRCHLSHRREGGVVKGTSEGC